MCQRVSYLKLLFNYYLPTMPSSRRTPSQASTQKRPREEEIDTISLLSNHGLREFDDAYPPGSSPLTLRNVLIKRGAVMRVGTW